MGTGINFKSNDEEEKSFLSHWDDDAYNNIGHVSTGDVILSKEQLFRRFKALSKKDKEWFKNKINSAKPIPPKSQIIIESGKIIG